MSLRLFACLVFAAVCGLPHAALAQPMPWNQGSGTIQQELPASHAYGPFDPHGATTHPYWSSYPIASQGVWWNDTVDGSRYGYGEVGNGGYPDSYGYPPGAPGPYGPGGGGIGYAPGQSPQFQYAQPPGAAQPQTRYELLPQDRGLLYDEDIARLRLLKEQMRTSWFRMDYLNYSMRNPGNTLLGAPISTTPDPRVPFLVTATDDTGNLVTVGSARVMDMTPVDLAHMNGARIAFGLPTGTGEFEGVFWGVETVARFNAPELTQALPNNLRIPPFNSNFTQPLQIPPAARTFQVPIGRYAPFFPTDRQNPNAVFIATSLRDNGENSTLLILYDADFSVKYNLKTWGSEANMSWDLRHPNDGWMLRALAGFRYTSHQEELIQHGTFNNVSALATPAPVVDPIFPDATLLIDPAIVNTIYSRTNNDVFAGQFGFKTELAATRWLTLGVTPKLALGANTYTAYVETRDLRDSPDLRDPNDPDVSLLPNPQDDGIVLTKVKQTKWSPGFDLGAYARLNLTDWASVQVGYNFQWLHNIARADEVIYYNDRGLNNAPAVVVQPAVEDFWLQGLSIGGVLTLPK